MPFSIPRIVCLLVAGMGLSIAYAQEPKRTEIRYALSSENFANPERGWYRYRQLEMSGDFDFAVRANQGSLIFLKIRADAYRNADLSSALLTRLQAAFAQARRDGVKLIPRVAYNDGPSSDCSAEYGCDAPKSIILRHIAQLAPLWQKNQDVLLVLDPGFIGGWGEWHTSSHGLDNPTDRSDILHAILDALPTDRMTVIRYPAFKREIFGGSQNSETAILTSAQAFSEANLARVGHLNDCFVSGEDDVGTYQFEGWNRSRELAYLGKEAPFTPFGGETCAVHAMGTCANTLAEMAALHIDYLNTDYHPDVLARWKTQGCLDTISLKLGHRLALEWAQLPDSVAPGGLLDLTFAVRNLGFGELFNPRRLEVVVSRPGDTLATALTEDPRRCAGGTRDTVRALLRLPAKLSEGTWSVAVRLADADSVLRRDPRYSIGFANVGVWNASFGLNVLKTNLMVTRAASGARDSSATQFGTVGLTKGAAVGRLQSNVCATQTCRNVAGQRTAPAASGVPAVWRVAAPKR